MTMDTPRGRSYVSREGCASHGRTLRTPGVCMTDSYDLEQPPAGGGVSRRGMVAAGVAGGLGIASVDSAADASPGRVLGSGPTGTTVVEFRGRIDQTGSSGQLFTSYGYLTRLAGARSSALFEGSVRNESTALLTVYASGDLVSRVLDVSVHSLDIAGTLTVFDRGHAGATFTDPASFKVGKPVARYDLTLQDVLAVYAAAQGIPTLTGDMQQTTARGLSGHLSGRRIGRRGSRLRMFATGLGKLVDPVTLNAQLEVAGNWSVE
jgi:hypothetical protein